MVASSSVFEAIPAISLHRPFHYMGIWRLDRSNSRAVADSSAVQRSGKRKGDKRGDICSLDKLPFFVVCFA